MCSSTTTFLPWFAVKMSQLRSLYESLLYVGLASYPGPTPSFWSLVVRGERAWKSGNEANVGLCDALACTVVLSNLPVSVVAGPSLGSNCM